MADNDPDIIEDGDYWIVDPDEFEEGYEQDCLQLELELMDKMIEIVSMMAETDEEGIFVLCPKHKIELNQLLTRSEKLWYYNEKFRRIK